MWHEARLIHLGHPEAHIPWVEVPETRRPGLSRDRRFSDSLSRSWLRGSEFPGALCPWRRRTRKVSWPWLAPFALLLACVALMPFIARRWWEHNYAYIAVVLGAIIITYYGWKVQFGTGESAAHGRGIHQLHLPARLAVHRLRRNPDPRRRSGDALDEHNAAADRRDHRQHLRHDRRGDVAHPAVSTDESSPRSVHTTSCSSRSSSRTAAASLTPIGDPPLFLGYLSGVPFSGWRSTAGRSGCLPMARCWSSSTCSSAQR